MTIGFDNMLSFAFSLRDHTDAIGQSSFDAASGYDSVTYPRTYLDLKRLRTMNNMYHMLGRPSAFVLFNPCLHCS